VSPFYRPHARAQWLLAAGLAVLSATLLVNLPPQKYAIYPACPFHEWFGLQCPGCGFTHALAALLTGRIREAASQNAMVLILVPGFLIFASRQTWSALFLNRWQRVRDRQFWFLAVSMLLFGLFRNLVPFSTASVQP
jgi:hypothetical protein